MNNVDLKQEDISTAPAAFSCTTGHVPVSQHVFIVMATYNGDRFIEEQIRSIQGQSYSNWLLFVRDDCSCDDTVQKVLQIECEDPRIRMVHDELGNLGAIGNFSALMEIALEENAAYVFFADQDDVWNSEKITTMLEAIQELEQSHGVQTPLLVHCDLTVVNDELKLIADSFMKFSSLSPTTADIGMLLNQNQVVGCASVINRALLDLACPVPRDVSMHDWWLALLASAVGNIGYVPKPLVKYRQHGRNTVGAVSIGQRLLKLMLSPKQTITHLNIVRSSIRQAEMLEERVRARGFVMSPIIKMQINTYAQILSVPFFKRVSELRKNKIEKRSFIPRIVHNLLVSIMKKKS